MDINGILHFCNIKIFSLMILTSQISTLLFQTTAIDLVLRGLPFLAFVSMGWMMVCCDLFMPTGHTIFSVLLQIFLLRSSAALKTPGDPDNIFHQLDQPRSFATSRK